MLRIWDTLARCLGCTMLSFVNGSGLCLRCARYR